ncbi:hypothetical protein AA313_de0209275 [Arthrobotrys entomopaga]|nr:hypothetical protein AA313_de0209275 [Arthrobotrys entomopaga]
MSTLEANVAIMTSSVPAVKPLITHLFPNSKLLRSLPRTTKETKAIEKFLGGDPSGASYSTMTAVEHSIRHVRHLSDEDLGFSDGFDGKGGLPATNWDPVVPELIAPIQLTDPIDSRINGTSSGLITQIKARGTQLSNDLGWIDTEISMATNGLDIESFKKGNMNMRMDLVDALRGGPVGIIPDLGTPTRQVTPQSEGSEADFKDLAEL